MGRHPLDAFSQPLQTEDQEEDADDQTEWTDWHRAERQPEHADDRDKYTEPGRHPEPGRSPTTRRTHPEHDRDHLDCLDRRGQERCDEYSRGCARHVW